MLCCSTRMTGPNGRKTRKRMIAAMPNINVNWLKVTIQLLVQFIALLTFIGGAVLFAGDRRWVTHEALDDKFTKQRIHVLNDKIFELELIDGICTRGHEQYDNIECSKLKKYKRDLRQLGG